MEGAWVVMLPSFDALVRAELEKIDAARDRERMGPFLAFIPPSRARAWAARDRFVDFSIIPSLAECFQRKRTPSVVIDRDPGDE